MRIKPIAFSQRPRFRKAWHQEDAQKFMYLGFLGFYISDRRKVTNYETAKRKIKDKILKHKKENAGN